MRTVVAGWPAEARVSASSTAGCNMVYTYTHKHGILLFLCFPTPWRVFSVYCFFFFFFLKGSYGTSCEPHFPVIF